MNHHLNTLFFLICMFFYRRIYFHFPWEICIYVCVCVCVFLYIYIYTFCVYLCCGTELWSIFWTVSCVVLVNLGKWQWLFHWADVLAFLFITTTDWIGAHCAFAVKTFFESGERVIVSRRAFHVHFMLHWNDSVLNRIFNL